MGSTEAREKGAFPMPDYEFFCQRCQRPFTVHMSVREHEERMPACPGCSSSQTVQRAISHFNVQTTRKSSGYR